MLRVIYDGIQIGACSTPHVYTSGGFEVGFILLDEDTCQKIGFRVPSGVTPFDLVDREGAVVYERCRILHYVMCARTLSERVVVYNSGYSRDEVVTTYVGMWAGEVLDVEVAREGWKPSSTRTVHRRREGQWPNVKVVSVGP